MKLLFTIEPQQIKQSERIGDAEVVFTNKVVISKEVLAACTALKFIGVLATGYNVVDVDTAKERRCGY